MTRPLVRNWFTLPVLGALLSYGGQLDTEFRA